MLHAFYFVFWTCALYACAYRCMYEGLHMHSHSVVNMPLCIGKTIEAHENSHGSFLPHAHMCTYTLIRTSHNVRQDVCEHVWVCLGPSKTILYMRIIVCVSACVCVCVLVCILYMHVCHTSAAKLQAMARLFVALEYGTHDGTNMKNTGFENP